MTSLTELAHSNQAAVPPFNGLLYGTAATVIPVLFLALTVQGHFFENLLKVMLNMSKADRQLARQHARPRVQAALYVVFGSGAALLALGVVYFCAFGEGAAIIILNMQSASNPWPYVVIASVIGLTVLTAAIPATALLRAVFVPASEAQPEHEPPAGTTDSSSATGS
jgi:hypothetical protein